MASSRSRRTHAGSKMASLLNEEEKDAIAGKDEFYDTTYGGFQEEKDDGDFAYHSPGEEDDKVDSDFSIDEDDEARSDIEDDGSSKRKTAKRGEGVQTKAYKEPKRDAATGTVIRRKSATSENEMKERQAAKVKARQERAARAAISVIDFGRKEARASTLQKTQETAERQKARVAKAKRLLKKKSRQKKDDKRVEMTQEEILAEAKLTEKLNLASLKKYEQMELENKKRANKITRKAVTGPYIRYLSTTMPVIDDSDSGCAGKEERISVDDDDSQDLESEQQPQRDSGNSSASKPSHERTFLTFSDFDTFRSSFPRSKARNSQQKICPITRLPAKYFDPVTRLPYANLQAFKILREAYYSQLEAKGDKSDPDVATWLDWRQKNKPSKPTYLSQVSRAPAAFSSRVPPTATAISQSPQLPTTPHPRQTTPSGASVAAAAAANSASQQNVVLPARTLNNSATVAAAAAAAQSVVTQLLKSSQPHPTAAAVTAQLPTQPMQTVKIGGHAAQVQLPRAMGTTTLTAAQLQQIANRSPTLQNALRASSAAVAGTGGTRAQLVTTRPPPAASSPAQQTMLRPQGGQIRTALPRQAGPNAVLTNRPQRTLASPIVIQQSAAAATAGGSGGSNSRGQQQIVVAGSGQHGQQGGSLTRQIVMTHPGGGGGTGGPGSARSGQIVQVTGQGGQQHQIVVSQGGGQYIINQQPGGQQQASSRN